MCSDLHSAVRQKLDKRARIEGVEARTARASEHEWKARASAPIERAPDRAVVLRGHFAAKAESVRSPSSQVYSVDVGSGASRKGRQLRQADFVTRSAAARMVQRCSRVSWHCLYMHTCQSGQMSQAGP